eukprot:Gb_26572 [translate_table: standard]
MKNWWLLVPQIVYAISVGGNLCAIIGCFPKRSFPFRILVVALGEEWAWSLCAHFLLPRNPQKGGFVYVHLGECGMNWSIHMSELGGCGALHMMGLATKRRKKREIKRGGDWACMRWMNWKPGVALRTSFRLLLLVSCGKDAWNTFCLKASGGVYMDVIGVFSMDLEVFF